MSRDCAECARLRRQVELLRRQVGRLLGGVRSAITFVETEQDTPSMPARHVPAAIRNRLTYIAEQAEGKRV